MPTYTTFAGRTITTDGKLGGGGEGIVSGIIGHNNVVAKVYHSHNRTPQRERKLQAMVANPPQSPPLDDTRRLSRLNISIAWPTELVYERGRFAGYLMPLIAQSPTVFNVYHPQKRARNYPDFDWRHLHRTAKNLATALNALHVLGHVMGDVNEGNILVTTNALVTLVDTDSFHVRAPNGQVYRGSVGVPRYTPQELQGLSLESIDRRIHHDSFGLAVIVFQLLMEGWHPFDGVPKDPNSPPIEGVDLHCIKQGIFPYQSNKAFNPPPTAPKFDALHPEARNLFLRCFLDGHKDPSRRPKAREWIDALDTAEKMLKQCKWNSSHWYSKRLGKKCSWCEREKQKPPPIQIGPPPPAKPNPPPPPPLPVKPKRRGLMVIILLIVLGVVGYYAITTPAPDFTGSSLAEAAERADRMKFETYVLSATDWPEPWGTVVGQSPPAEERVADRRVGLIISGRQGPVAVPDVSGLSKLEACKALMQSGLNSEQCGTWDVVRGGGMVFTANGPDWTVEVTDPPAGTEVQVGTWVSIRYRFQRAFEDDFSNTDSGWWPVTNSDESGNYYAEGGYYIYKLQDGSRWTFTDGAGTVDDVIVEVDIVASSGISSDESPGWGIICGVDDSDNDSHNDSHNYYLLKVEGDGSVGIYKRNNGELSTLDTGYAGNALNEGGVNHLKGSCIENTLRLYVNGQQFAEAEDEEFDSGKVGLYAEDGEVLFDNFVVYTPDGTLAPDAATARK